MKTEDTEALGRQRAKPSKIKVDRPVRTAHMFVHHYNSTHYCNTETVFIYILLPPDQHVMWPSGGKGVCRTY